MVAVVAVAVIAVAVVAVAVVAVIAVAFAGVVLFLFFFVVVDAAFARSSRSTSLRRRTISARSSAVTCQLRQLMSLIEYNGLYLHLRAERLDQPVCFGQLLLQLSHLTLETSDLGVDDTLSPMS